MSNSGRSIRFPFTASQWQELEHQALVFKYMVTGMPIPQDLLFAIRRSMDSSSLISSKFLIHQPQNIGWNSYSNMGFGRKIDPEPGRCRRTDGKKWRCSKDAYPDSKYCERHMHRGRNRSRKPVEILSSPNTTPNNAIPIVNASSSITLHKNTHTSPTAVCPISSYLTSAAPDHFLSPHFSSGFALSSQENTNNFFFENTKKDCRNSSYNGHGMRGGSDEHAFFSSEGNCDSSSNSKVSQLTLMGSSLSQMKHNNNAYYSSDLLSGIPLNLENRDIDEQKPKKVMHHFLDECPPKEKDCSNWLSSEEKMQRQRTQLSISIPNSLHDFFMTQKW